MIGFVHIPKCGGTTMKFVLRNTFGFRHCNFRELDGRYRAVPQDLALARRLHPGLRSIAGHALIHPTEFFPDVRFFTFLRDPVVRVASAYAHHVRGGRRRERGEPELTLEQFLRKHRPGGNQTYQVAGTTDPDEAFDLLREKYLFVGLTERFAESLAVLAVLSPYRLDTRYTRRNVAPVDDPVRKSLLEDPAKCALIEEANQSDRVLYDRVVEELYPVYREQALERTGGVLPDVGGSVGDLRYRLSRGWDRIISRPLLRRQARRLAAEAGG